MDTEHAIGLPPAKDAEPAAPVTPKALWLARGVNLFGLVSPAANLGLVSVAPKDQRWFGLGAGIVCAAVIVYGASAGHPRLTWFAAGIHYALVLAGLIHPLWVAAIGKAWAGFGGLLGKVMVYPIFAVIYYLVVTPTGLLLRAFGKDPLQRKAPPSATYWTPHEPPAKEKYERQF